MTVVFWVSTRRFQVDGRRQDAELLGLRIVTPKEDREAERNHWMIKAKGRPPSARKPNDSAVLCRATAEAGMLPESRVVRQGRSVQGRGGRSYDGDVEVGDRTTTTNSAGEVCSKQREGPVATASTVRDGVRCE